MRAASRRTALVLCCAAVVACSGGSDEAQPAPSRTSSPAPSPSASVAQPAAVLVGAGDIAMCTTRRDEATAKLVEGVAGTVATFGDNAYPKGTATDFSRCYAGGWGRFKARTRPALGNHDYGTPGAAAYFSYFGANAGPRGKGYYSYRLGSWHVVVLNSNCSIVSCAKGSAQERWLRADLASHRTRCTLAYWHHPRYTSSRQHGPDLSVKPLFKALHEHGADVVLAGHSHVYERFAPMDADDRIDRARGIRSFVVGTGGATLYDFGPTRPGSEARGRAHGVIRLTLRADGYDWRFLPIAGSSYDDRGRGTCH